MKLVRKLRHGLVGMSLLVFLLVLVGLLPAQFVSHGQGNDWSDPVLLGPGWFPDIAVDATGRVHIVWASVRMPERSRVPRSTEVPLGYDIVSYATFLEGEGWSDVLDIIAKKQVSGSAVTRPSAHIDERGIFDLTFTDGYLAYYTQAPAYEAYSARAWSKWVPLSVDQIAYFSKLVRDSNGILHLVYTENVRTANCPICFHVYYRWSDDDGLNWSIRYDLSDLPTGAAKPQILVDEEDNLHVVWEAGRGGALGQLSDPTTALYSASYDGGKTWTRPLEFVVPNGRAKNITIGLDGLGQLVVAWLALPEDLVYYQVSRDQGRTWTRAEPIPGIFGGWTAYVSRLDDYHMATDSAGNVHLVLVGRTDEEEKTSLDLLHMTWNGAAWLAPDVITTLKGDVPEWPRIAVGNGNELHVTWFVRDEAHIFDSERGVYTVWHSQGVSDAPFVPPQTIPTLTPTPTPTIQQADLEVTPSLTPPNPEIALTPISQEISASLYTEMDEMILIGSALVPAALLIVLAFAVIRLRRP